MRCTETHRQFPPGDGTTLLQLQHICRQLAVQQQKQKVFKINTKATSRSEAISQSLLGRWTHKPFTQNLHGVRESIIENTNVSEFKLHVYAHHISVNCMTLSWEQTCRLVTKNLHPKHGNIHRYSTLRQAVLMKQLSSVQTRPCADGQHTRTL